MIDMLVRLYDLPDVSELVAKLGTNGIIIRRANAYERHIVADWVGNMFSSKWVSETKIAFSRQPVSCYIATKDKSVIGFACYDTTSKGFLGPMGVDLDNRISGVGTALLVRALEGLKNDGYAYGIIGGVGPEDFYRKTVGATPIENSTPGIYRDILPEKP